MTRIALVCGFWGQNIGNAFFNLGGEAILRDAGHHVSLVQDQPAYWTFRDESKGNYPRAFGLLEELDVDLVVLQGPLWTRNFGNIWLKTLTELDRRGIGWGVLGGGFRSYTADEVQVAREIIERFPPTFVSTRDDEAFTRIEAYVPHARSGIDSAFFLPIAFDPPEMTGDPIVALAFDHFLEPRIEVGDVADEPATWRLEHPSRLDSLAGRSKAHAYVGQMLDRRVAPEQIGSYRIVRPCHRTNPHLPIRIYKRPGGLASDEPWTYATVYANSSATISDRVHACVATLAYGNPARLHNPTTKRSALFDRVGVGDINQRLCSLRPDFLLEERDSALRFLEKLG